jgi:hypothetical protein
MTAQDTVNIFVKVIIVLGIVGFIIFMVVSTREPKSLDVPEYVHNELQKRDVGSYSVELAYVAKDSKGKIYIVKRREHD